jgi:hypothetical protein
MRLLNVCKHWKGRSTLNKRHAYSIAEAIIILNNIMAEPNRSAHKRDDPDFEPMF